MPETSCGGFYKIRAGAQVVSNVISVSTRTDTVAMEDDGSEDTEIITTTVEQVSSNAFSLEGTIHLRCPDIAGVL